MGITSKSNRPHEFAHKANHTYIINDEKVQSFLKDCQLPSDTDEVEIEKDVIANFEMIEYEPLKAIITVDGGYTEVEVKKTYPTSTITFFQFGAFWLNLEQWDGLNEKPFISPEDMAKFNDLERIKFVFPTKGIGYKKQDSFIKSARRAIYDFFMEKHDGKSTLMETLKWLVFEEFSSKNNVESYQLTNQKLISDESIPSISLRKAEMNTDYTFTFGNNVIYLTDVFRFHESMDEELGAGGVLGNLTNTIEQIIIFHYIKMVLELSPNLMHSILFIKDGNLSVPDRAARIHRSIRRLNNYLIKKHNLFLVGLEKSGVFVEHADEITKSIEVKDKDGDTVFNKNDEIVYKNKLQKGKILFLSNKYIRKYIAPGNGRFGETSYYSGKLIYHSSKGNVYVATIPVENKEVMDKPCKEKFHNLEIILDNIDSLKCDMYDNALVPITLANRLVSLSNYPSKILLENFARDGIYIK